MLLKQASNNSFFCFCQEMVNLRCSNCGLCCEETMMELSISDVERLEEKGFSLKEFTVLNDNATYLKNVDGYCFFYNHIDKNCRIYEDRPLGCQIYPVVYLLNEGMIIDELCPIGKTILKQELMEKAKMLDKLLKKIDTESENGQVFSNCSGFKKPIYYGKLTKR